MEVLWVKYRNFIFSLIQIELNLIPLPSKRAYIPFYNAEGTNGQQGITITTVVIVNVF